MGDSNFGLYEDQENLFEEHTVAACRHLQIAADKAYQDQNDGQAYLAASTNKWQTNTSKTPISSSAKCWPLANHK
ncbi:hypothetical protein [Secundilactobacillus kimchicus]|uniref:hypothetical protein n=1 Tax=Secundilactobacillus kimchicus TaxID=528209 RepID=UPI000AADC01A